jgi:altronate hydrolase
MLTDVAVRLDTRDNVAIARAAIATGTVIHIECDGGMQTLEILDPIPTGHKFALEDLAAGAAVLRYGQYIGQASRAIRTGEWVHTHNLELPESARAGIQHPRPVRTDAGPAEPVPVFQGYRRADGRVGTRNFFAVISTVSCSAQTAMAIAAYFTPERMAAYPNVDGVVAITHFAGCSTPPNSLAGEFMRRITRNVAHHPNVGAAVYVTLGCEGNQVPPCPAETCACAGANVETGSVPVLSIQVLGGIRKTIQAGIETVETLLPIVNAARRTPVPVSELTVALQCGGSDGWSGVTANPVVGRVSDRIVSFGGTTVLAETPEIYGAEGLLTRRAVDEPTAQKLMDRVAWWEHQAELGGFSLDQNPSPGNKAGGLTNIFEKSLGAVAKGGSTPLQAVYEYAETVDRRGLVFMDTPGNDAASVTGQVAGGCTLVLFTTGRGSVFGGNLAPCLKIATNNDLFVAMEDDMDYNAGQVLSGQGVDSCGQDLFEMVLRTASGERTRSEAKEFREGEFVPWQPGTLL